NDIIVYVDGAETTKPRIKFAAALAKDHGAHLIGVGFAPTALLPLYGVDACFADMSEVLQSVKSQGETALHACESHCEAQGVSIEIRLRRGVSDESPRAFACCARHVDITVLGQPRHGDPLIGQYALVERCLFASGRPVIIVPAAPAAMVRPATVVVAWDGSPQAAQRLQRRADCPQAGRPRGVPGPCGRRAWRGWRASRGGYGGASEAPRCCLRGGAPEAWRRR